LHFNFFVKPEPEMVYKDKLHKINPWIMRAFLLVAFIFSDFFATNMTVNQTVMQSGLMYYLSSDIIYPVVHVTSGILSVLFFELIGNVYYSLIRPICPPVNLTKKGFLTYLRFGYVVRGVVCGLIKLLFLYGDVYYVAFNLLIEVVITTLCVLGIYLYVNKNYVPEREKGPFMRLALMPYLVVQLVVVLGGILL